jgi:hypothetical protein
VELFGFSGFRISRCGASLVRNDGLLALRHSLFGESEVPKGRYMKSALADFILVVAIGTY